MSQLTKEYIPTLDGWRAIAVVSVAFFHDSIHRWGPVSTSLLYKQGHHGVDLFFAISGLLIAERLLREEDQQGGISLKTFYWRRLFRIQPAALTYLAVVLMLSLTHLIPSSTLALVASLVMLRNFFPTSKDIHQHDVLLTNHFWSLSVEEHFYLVLPGFLKLVRRQRFPLLLGLVVALYTWSIVVDLTPRLQFGPLLEWRTDIQIKSLLVAATFAIVIHTRRSLIEAKAWMIPTATLVLLGLIFFLEVNHRWEVKEIYPLFCTALVASTMLNPASLPSRLLELAPLRFIGRMSYGIYIWQQLFFQGHADPGWHPLGLIQTWPWRLVSLALVALFSYYVLEKPLIRFSHKFSLYPKDNRQTTTPALTVLADKLDSFQEKMQTPDISVVQPARVLLFFPFCFASGTQGNEQRVLHLMEYFIERNFIVDVLSYQGQGGHWWKREERLPQNGVLELVQWGSLFKRAFRKAVFLTCRPFLGHSRIDLELIKRFQKMLAVKQYSYVIASYAHYAHLLSLVKDKQTTKLCDTHDIWTIVEKSRHGIADSPGAVGRALSWEIATLNRADIVLAISPSEEQFFRSVLSCKVALLPPWFEISERRLGNRPPKYDLIYVGTDNYLNIEGLRWFFKEILPAFPNLKLLIVGNICRSLGEFTASFPNVTLAGFVANVADSYISAKAALCPMLGGAGVKIKVIEALSHGLPVFASRIVESGLLPGYEGACFMADGSEEFRNLLARFDSLVSHNTAAAYSKAYSRESIAERADQIFRQKELVHEKCLDHA